MKIGCASAILSELRRKSHSINTVLTGACSHNVRFIKAICLTTYVLCSPETLKLLQVFPSELHSKGQSWGMKGVAQYEMQSISLYNLLYSLTHTPQGRARLRTFLRSPLSNLGIIESRQLAISQLLDRQKSGALQEIIKTLKKIRNAKICVELLRRGVDRSSMIHHFGDSVWSNLRGFVYHALKLRDLVYTLTNNPVDFLHDVCDPSFDAIIE